MISYYTDADESGTEEWTMSAGGAFSLHDHGDATTTTQGNLAQFREEVHHVGAGHSAVVRFCDFWWVVNPRGSGRIGGGAIVSALGTMSAWAGLPARRIPGRARFQVFTDMSIRVGGVLLSAPRVSIDGGGAGPQFGNGVNVIGGGSSGDGGVWTPAFETITVPSAVDYDGRQRVVVHVSITTTLKAGSYAGGAEIDFSGRTHHLRVPLMWLTID